MSGIADDWEAQVRMLQQAHEALSQRNPTDPLLSHYDPHEEALNFRTLVEALGIEKEYDAHPHPNLYAMAVYTERLKI